jgi:TIR domain
MISDGIFGGSIFIYRPIMEVFNYTYEPKSMTQWQPFITQIDVIKKAQINGIEKAKGVALDPVDTTEGPIETYDVKLQLRPLSRGPKIRVELTDTTPGRLLYYRCYSTGMNCSIRFEPFSRGTLVNVSLSYFSWQALLFGLTALPIRPWFNDLISQTLESLKRNAENRSVQSDPFIFFSYRREHAKYTGGRIYDALIQEFGEGFVFRDIDSISGGSKWRDRISNALENCKVVIAHIDDGWEDTIHDKISKGKDDVLREELETAIKGKKFVVPLFTSSDPTFSMNKRLKKIQDTLPEGALKDALRGRQGLLLRSDPDFQSDLQKLIQTVWREVRASRKN